MNRLVDDIIILILVFIISIILCGVWIIVFFFMEVNVIYWFNIICVIKYCFIGVFVFGYIRYCKCFFVCVVYVLIGFIID